MGHNPLGEEVRASVNVAYVAQMIAVGASAQVVAAAGMQGPTAVRGQPHS